MLLSSDTFSSKVDVSWKCDDNEKHPELSVMVSLEDGTCATIEQLPVTVPTKTLGQMTCSPRSSNGAIVQMKEKLQGWVDKAKFFWTNSFCQELPLGSVAFALRLVN
jgi:hypothetical protein